MLQNERFGTDLKRYLPYARILDQSKTSDQYFRLFDVPDKLYVGKNSFRIRINKDTLVKGSLIYIDVVDSTGEIIFHEVADFIGEDGSRLIIVHVYEDTPPGEATIYIGGRASYDVIGKKQLTYNNDPSSVDFIDFPNIIWSGKVVVIPTNENENEIIFAKAPSVKVKERSERYKSYTPGENRKVNVTGSFNVTINPITTAYEYSDSSKSGNKLSENSVNVILDPGVTNNTAESRQKSIPQFSELSTLYDANGSFTEDFKGGEIIIRNLTEQLNVSDVNVSDFSCSIIEVVDSHNVKIAPEFKFVYGEKNQNVLKAIKNATNVTASYYTTKTDLVTFDSESFIQIDFENLEPIAGKVDSVSLSYKPFGSFGEFKPIGDFRITPQEFLVDTSNLVISKTELIERPIGKPSGSSEFTTYWEVISGKYPAGAFSSGSFLNQGIYFKTSNEINDPSLEYDYKLKVKPDYGIHTVPNTEFKLSFTINLEGKRDDNEDFQLDVFISGSSILRDTISDKRTTTILSNNSEGERISSVTKQTTGAVNTYTYYFKTISGGRIYPVFVIKNALIFSMKNISIQPRNEFGYSPNQAKLFIPVDTLKTNTELVLNIDYLTKKKERSKISSQVYGLVFSGSGLTPSIIDNGLQNSQTFISISESISSASVQTLGTSLYSFNPYTSNFSSANGVFLGSEAGQNATQANFAIFLGKQAGATADQAEGSVFIGYQAGLSGSNANDSQFIGQYAGFNATNCDNSTFIGIQAGYNSFDAYESIFIGSSAGSESPYAFSSNFIGYGAGRRAERAWASNFIGYQAGFEADSASISNFIGRFAGNNAKYANDSNFIGNEAGNNAAYSGDSNFIGRSAGRNAYTASNSNFIGYFAGQSAVNAYSSNFIGNTAGRYASSASYSNFIGFKAGYAAASGISPSTNNIVIGTMISVPYNSQNQVNIGGLIFGSGSYFPPTVSGENIFSGSTNGRIGINQPNPQKSLDISGSIRVSDLITPTATTKMVVTNDTGDLSFIDIPTTGDSFPYTGSAIISGSLIVTGSIYSTNGFSGSLFGTSSWAINSITSSFTQQSLSSSYALTASYALNAGGGGISLNGGTNVDNRLITATGTTPELNGENNLTFDGTSLNVTGSIYVTNDIIVNGKITAEEFYTEYVSSSIIFRSGSSKFGDTSDDIHQFTGSLRISGSLRVSDLVSTKIPPVTVGKTRMVISDENGDLSFTDICCSELSSSIAILSGSVNTISGSLDTKINTLSGSFTTLSGSYTTLSGSFVNVSSSLSNLSGSVITLSGSLDTKINNVSSSFSSSLSNLSGSLSSSISLLSGSVNTRITNVSSSFSSSISILSGSISSSISILSGSVSSSISNLSGSVSSSISFVSSSVSSSVSSLSGSVNTRVTNISSSFSSSISILSGSVSSSISFLSGSVSSSVSNLSGSVSTLVSNVSSSFSSSISILSGSISSSISNLSGSISLIISNLSGSVSSSISNLSGSISILSGSLLNVSSSLDSRITNVSSSLDSRITNVSSSFSSSISILSGSISSSLSNLSGSISSISGSLINVSSSLDTKINNVSSSLDTKINNVSSSFSSSLSLLSGSFSSSLSILSGSVSSSISNLSGSVSSSVSGLSGSLSVLSGSLINVSSSLDSKINNVSSSLDSKINNVSSSFSSSISILSGSISSSLSTLSGSVSYLSGSVLSVSSSLDSKINNVSSSFSSSLSSLSGSLSSSLSILSGSVSSSISNLSGSLSSSLSSLSGSVSSSISNLSGSVSSSIGILSGSVSSSISNLSGSFSSSISLLSGSVSSSISTLSGSVSSSIGTLSGSFSSSISLLSGSISSSISNLSGSISSSISTLSGSFSSSISILSGSVSSSISNLSGSVSSSVSILSGSVSSSISFLSGSVSSSIGILSGSVSSSISNLSGSVSSSISFFSGSVSSSISNLSGSISSSIANLSGSISSSISILSGSVSSSISNLSGSVSSSISLLSASFSSSLSTLSGSVSSSISFLSGSVSSSISNLSGSVSSSISLLSSSLASRINSLEKGDRFLSGSTEGGTTWQDSDNGHIIYLKPVRVDPPATNNITYTLPASPRNEASVTVVLVSKAWGTGSINPNGLTINGNGGYYRMTENYQTVKLAYSSLTTVGGEWFVISSNSGSIYV